MGCCSSRESPYASPPATSEIQQNHHAANNSSRAAIIHTPAAVAARNSSSSASQTSVPTAAQNATGAAAAAAAAAADGRPNAPLRTPSPVAKSPQELTLRPWTRTELHKQREAFFETRVSGSAEVWSALRLLCELLRAGELREAQGVLDAAGLTCPTGRVVGDRRSRKAGRGVYDERGLLYEIPGWVVRDPGDIVEEEVVVEKRRSLEVVGGKEVDEEDAARIRDEKGKGREGDVGESVTVKARLSDRGTDVLVAVGKEQKVAVLIERIQEKAGLSGKVRLAYMGKMMDDSKTLAEVGWREGHVVNALVFEP